MHISSASAALLFALVTTAVWSAPNLPPFATDVLSASDDLLDLSRPLPPSKRIGETDFYFSQFGGGSAALGILFGFVGSHVSGAMIDAKTEEMAKAFKVSIKLGVPERLKAKLAVHNGGAPYTNSKDGYRLSSALLMQLGRDGKLRTSLVVQAAGQQAAKEPWTGNYFYHFSGAPDSPLSDGRKFEEYLEGISKEIDEAVTVLLKAAADDLAGRYKDGASLWVTSDYFANFYMIPYAAIHLTEEKDRRVLRIDGYPGTRLMPYAQGVHVFRAEQFEGKPR